jgi:hypothetical protein
MHELGGRSNRYQNTKIMKKRNTYEINGNTVTVCIRTKKHPEAEMLIDLEDWEMLQDLQDDGQLGRICCSKKKLEHTGYALAKFNEKTFTIHRLLLPDSEQVDHISRDGLDNRRSNIREADAKLNGRNRKKRSTNTSGTTGVCWCGQRQRWRARININDKQVNLGYFTALCEAIAVRKAAEVSNGYLCA